MCEPTDATSKSNSDKEENGGTEVPQLVVADFETGLQLLHCRIQLLAAPVHRVPARRAAPRGLATARSYAPKVTGEGEPLAVTVTCPGRVPECKFWDANIERLGRRRLYRNDYTNSSITCECTR